MEITVNGNPATINDGTTVSQLMSSLNITPGGTAVAVNGKIVKKETWDSTVLSAADNVTVIRAAYGG